MLAFKSKSKSKLSEKLKVKAPTKREPLWKGPEDDGPLGGITQSMLNGFLGCRHRFYIKYVEGMQVVQGFSKALEYGNMWHVCEEHFAKEPKGTKTSDRWQLPLRTYCQDLCRKYPLNQEEIDKWYNVCLVQFPLYADWWSKHPDVLDRTPLLQEEVFHVPYKLPSGRTVWLKGKFDSVDLVGKGKNAGIWLKENKSKSDIDETRLQRQLNFDLQTMIYLIALEEITKNPSIEVKNAGPAWRRVGVVNGKKVSTTYPIKGVNYNVVRRPLSGGRGTVVQHKPTKSNPNGESSEEYYARIKGIIEGAVGPEWNMPEGQHFFFQRWQVEIIQSDVERFKEQFLNPILEQLCNWYEFVTSGDPWRGSDPIATRVPGDPPDHFGIHFMLPFGLYNPLVENGFTDVDEYLLCGNDAGLQRVETLFGELQ